MNKPKSLEFMLSEQRIKEVGKPSENICLEMWCATEGTGPLNVTLRTTEEIAKYLCLQLQQTN